jgi:hypothetical protein
VTGLDSVTTSTNVRGPILGEDCCPFVARCHHAIGICHTVRPALEPNARGTLVACHRAGETWPPSLGEPSEIGFGLPGATNGKS